MLAVGEVGSPHQVVGAGRRIICRICRVQRRGQVGLCRVGHGVQFFRGTRGERRRRIRALVVEVESSAEVALGWRVRIKLLLQIRPALASGQSERPLSGPALAAQPRDVLVDVDIALARRQPQLAGVVILAGGQLHRLAVDGSPGQPLEVELRPPAVVGQADPADLQRRVRLGHDGLVLAVLVRRAAEVDEVGLGQAGARQAALLRGRLGVGRQVRQAQPLTHGEQHLRLLLRDWAKLISRKERWTYSEARQEVERRELESDRRRQKKEAAEEKAQALARIGDYLDVSRAMTFHGEMTEAEEAAWRDAYRAAIEPYPYLHLDKAKQEADAAVRAMRPATEEQEKESESSDEPYVPSEAEVAADRAAALVYERRSIRLHEMAAEIRTWPQPEPSGEDDYDVVFELRSKFSGLADDLEDDYAPALHEIAVILYADPSLRLGDQGRFTEFDAGDAEVLAASEKALAEAVEAQD